MKERLRTGIRALWSGLLDLLYPGACFRCGAAVPGGRSLCGACADELPTLREPFCRQCGMEFEGQIEGGFACANCRGERFSFDFARPAMSSHPDLREMIHQLKYLRRIDLAAELGALAERAFDEEPRLAAARAERWLLVPVPLHRSRLAWRHFNQAEEIARELSRRTGLPLCPALVRNRKTGSQTRLSRVQRLKNLRGAFHLSGEGRSLCRLKPAGVVIVDDVFTTGATTDECAGVLRKAGIQKVVVVTVMRG